MKERKEIHLFKAHLDVDLAMLYLRDVLESGFLNEGQQVIELTKEFQRLLRTDQVIMVNSCTSALTMALKLAGVQEGDDVVTTSMTCVATNMPIKHVGANIRWADVDSDTGMISAETLKAALTPNTKAVIVVLWAGNPSELDEIQKVCKENNVKLILDAAHGLFAKYDGKQIHEFGNYTCFPANTKITTKEGCKKIKDIKVGEFVLTSTGEYKPVIETLQRKYQGSWTSIKAGQCKISATSNHPIKVYRNGTDEWIPIGEIVQNDFVYIQTKLCEKCSLNLIPIYGSSCRECYSISNRSKRKAEKISESRKHDRKTSRLDHHCRDVSPVMENYRTDGYRVIPLIHALPDFIAIKDGRIIAVEVESGSSIRISKSKKYEPLGADNYDDVEWHTLKNVKNWPGRYKYEIVENFARVHVSKVRNFTSQKTKTVYNLTLEQDDPTYVAGGILVHNCYSFQAIKHVTTGDGGALVCTNEEDYSESKKMKWFGLDRDRAKDENGNWKGQQWDVDIEDVGYKFNMNNISAAIGLSQISHIDKIMSKHRSNSVSYDELFKTTELIKPIKKDPKADGSSWVYTVVLHDSIASKRDEILKRLNNEGIRAGVVHVPNHDYTVFRDEHEDLPGVKRFFDRQFSLPCGWWMKKYDVSYVFDRVMVHVENCAKEIE